MEATAHIRVLNILLDRIEACADEKETKHLVQQIRQLIDEMFVEATAPE